MQSRRRARCRIRRGSPSGSSTGRIGRPIASFSPSATATGAWRPRHLRAGAGARARASSQALLDRGLSSERPGRHPVRQQHRARAAGARRDVRRRALRADRARLFAAGEGLRHAAARSSSACGPGWCSPPKARAFERALRRVMPDGRRARRVVVDPARRRLRPRRSPSSRPRARRPPWTTAQRAASARTRSPRSCSRRDRPAARRASSTRSACSARIRR